MALTTQGTPETAHELGSLTDAFWRDGFVMLRGVFADDEVDVLREAIHNHDEMQQSRRETQAKYESGKYPSFETIFVWNDVSGEDLFARFTRRYVLFDLLESIFNDVPYVYHNKIALKYDRMPGFKFHQDYFYWYQMGNIYPDMATAFIAIDPATPDNGCLRLIKGSHRAGRIDHVLADGQRYSDSWVDDDRLAALKERHEEVECVMEPGDVVLFHCNTLHGSAANHSGKSRLSLLGCYNTKRNDPIVRSHAHPNFVVQSKFYDRVTPDHAETLPDFRLSLAE